MKTKKRIMLVLTGVTVAVITAAVPVMKRSGLTVQRPNQEVGKCYTEAEVLLMMELTNSSRQRAMDILDMSCRNAIKAEEKMQKVEDVE
jgi:hypothetical protein